MARGERLKPGEYGVINTTKLKPGKWRARCYWRDKTGKLRRIERSGTTESQAANRLKLARTQGRFTLVKTVQDLLEEWLKQHDGISTSTRERYQDSLRRHLIPTLGQVRVEDLSSPVIEQGLRDIYVDNSRFAAQRARTLLAMACKWGARMGIVERDFTAEVPIPGKQSRTRPWSPTDDQVTLLLELPQSEYDQPGRSGPKSPSAWLAALLMSTTGGRIGEVCAARWEDVDWEVGTLTYRDTVVYEAGKNSFRGHLKNEDPSRTVYLPLPTLHILRQHRQETGFICAAREGGPMQTGNLRRTWRRVYDRAGIPVDERVRPHDLRRSVGTRLTHALGVDAASAQLGDTRKITERHYVQPTYTGPQEVREVLG